MRLGRAAQDTLLQARLPELQSQLAPIRTERILVIGKQDSLLRRSYQNTREQRRALMGLRTEQERLGERERKAIYDFVDTYDQRIRFSAPAKVAVLAGLAAIVWSLASMATERSTIVNDAVAVSLMLGGYSAVIGIMGRARVRFMQSLKIVQDAVGHASMA